MANIKVGSAAGLNAIANARYLKEHASSALVEIDNYKVSARMQPSYDAFKSALQDFRDVGKELDAGFSELDGNKIRLGMSYLDSAQSNMQRALDLLPK